MPCPSEHPCKQSDLRGRTLFCFVFSKKMKRITSPQFDYKGNRNKPNPLTLAAKVSQYSHFITWWVTNPPYKNSCKNNHLSIKLMPKRRPYRRCRRTCKLSLLHHPCLIPQTPCFHCHSKSICHLHRVLC